MKNDARYNTLGLLTVRGALVATILVGCVLLVSCPPDGPPVPPASPTPPGDASELSDGYEEEDYDDVIHNANFVLERAADDSDIRFGHLYRGLAELGRRGETEAALADLQKAEEQLDQFEVEEQVLLFRGLMIAYRRLGDDELAAKYRDSALEMAPDQEELIEKEYEGAVQ